MFNFKFPLTTRQHVHQSREDCSSFSQIACVYLYLYMDEYIGYVYGCSPAFCCQAEPTVSERMQCLGQPSAQMVSTAPHIQGMPQCRAQLVYAATQCSTTRRTRKANRHLCEKLENRIVFVSFFVWV